MSEDKKIKISIKHLYKIFGDRAKGSEGEKAGRIAEYQILKTCN